MAPWPAFVAAGVALGALTGLFGVGGSSIATPMLVILGASAPLALGAVPASALSGRLAHRVAGAELRRVFGWCLIVSGLAFVVYRLILV